MSTATHLVLTQKSPNQYVGLRLTGLVVGLLTTCLLAIGVSTVDGVKELIAPQFDDRLPMILGILGAVAFSAFLSGIFGMLGGTVLIGIAVCLLDLTTAMLLVATVMIASTGWRALTSFRQIDWSAVLRITTGAIVAFALLSALAFTPAKWIVFLGLGLPVIGVSFIPKRMWPSVDSIKGQFAVGFLSGMCQFIGATSSAVMDLFYQNSTLTRAENVALKSASIVPILVMRAAFFAIFAWRTAGAIECTLPVWVLAVAVVLSFAGTAMGGYVLRNWFSDKGFLKWTWSISIFVSLVFVAQGFWLLAGEYSAEPVEAF